MMKLVSATSALLVVASSTTGTTHAQSVSETYTDLAFTGYDGVDDCAEGAEFLTGYALKTSLSDVYPDAICEETEYTMDGNTFTSYTGVVLMCNSVAIGKNYFSCNKDCQKCDDEPFQYATQTWENAQIGTDAPTCYANAATVAAGADAEDGVETVVLTSSWTFTDDSEPEEVEKYMQFVLDNTCVGDGPPEIDEEEAGVTCLSYSDMICEELDDSSPYTLTTACTIFKDLDTDEPFNSTIFVPTDTAFENFDTLVGISDVDRLSDDNLMDIVMFHGTEQPLLYSDLECSGLIDMWCVDSCGQSRTKCMKTEDGNVAKYQKGGGNRKNDMLPEIIVADILACNGNVIHIISEVMLPNDIDKIGRRD